MGHAQEMLAFSTKDISQIAADCGYQELSYFYAVFRKYAGCTPHAFRETYKTRKGEASPETSRSEKS